MISIKSSFPVLVTTDIAQQKTFYCDHFGFKAVYFEPTFFVHLEHPETGIQIGFMVPDHPSQPEWLHPTAPTVGMVVSFEVDDAQVAYKEAKRLGLEVVMDIKKEVFNQTHFMVKDPAGVILDIVEDNN